MIEDDEYKIMFNDSSVCIPCMAVIDCAILISISPGYPTIHDVPTVA